MKMTQAEARGDAADAREQVSAMIDGELAGGEADAMIRTLRDSAELDACWREYHLIRDALRGEALPTRRRRTRLEARLSAEPTVLAPRRSRFARPAAVLALAASLMALAIVSWNLVRQPDGAQTVALSPSDFDRVNPYLAAHQEFSSVAGTANPMATRASLSPE